MQIKWLLLLAVVFHGLTGQSQSQQPPNVILIMADDMGHECLGAYGSTYQTPALDSLAAHGIRFTNAISQPLCTPSRVKIMTGLRNYRNYTHFGYLGRDQKTIGHLMKAAGYATLIAGKWQLNGLANKMPDAGDNSLPYKFGFDEYSLWQLTQTRTKNSERYANPLIEKNGKLLEQDPDQYGPDLFLEHVLDFIERKKEAPFFVYYPMVLVHDPFVPTPNTKDWEDPALRYQADTAYFRHMVQYADQVVGQIVAKVKQLELENTIIIFTGDNGTHPTVFTPTDQGIIRGDKGRPTDGGTKVPLIVNWPAREQAGRVTDGLVEFTDFYATLAELTGQQGTTDGLSFLNVLEGAPDTHRKTAMVYYDPRWGNHVPAFFVRDKRYKLYQDGRFFDLDKDRLEANPIPQAQLSSEATAALKALTKEMQEAPTWPGPDLPFLFTEPLEIRDSQLYPLVLCLHGAGGRGTDNQGRGSEAFKVMNSPEMREKYPAYLLMPQCPTGESWVDANWNSGYSIDSTRISNELQAVSKLIDRIILEYPVDPKRIYITGQSMGGFGTWDLLMRRPGLFAAAVPVCGGGDITKVQDLDQTGIWLFHSADDPTVPVTLSRELYQALQAAGHPGVRYTEFPAGGHQSWVPAWNNEITINWLFEQKRSMDER